MLELSVQPRSDIGKKANRVRRTGAIPAVLYGYGTKNQPITVDSRAFEKVWKEVGESTLISIRVGEEKYQTALIHDVTRDVLQGHPLHIDFYAVRMDRPLETHVPLVFIGEAEAVKTLGGILVKVAHELHIRALPQNLPHEIEIDIAPLKTFDDQLLLKNITLPEGVEALVDPDHMLALVEAPRTEEELAAMEQPADVSLENIEVSGEKEEGEETTDETTKAE